jgi:hypothetical protein
VRAAADDKKETMMQSGLPTSGNRPTFDKAPILGGILLGFIASLCCGGTMVFAAIGLGAFYGSLQLSHHIPEALATGAILIILLNWLYYRRKAARMLDTRGGYDRASLRRAMLLSGSIGLVKMSLIFVFLEWLNHGVVHAAHFMANPEYSAALIPGVPNSHLTYLALTYVALGALTVLPLPEAASHAGIQRA